MMCHTASKDCNPCHTKENVKIAPLADTYSSIMRTPAKDPSIKIYPTGSTSMAQCVYCHPDLDAIVPGRVIFAHAAHLRRDYPCETCHPKFGHSAKGPAVPDMLSCYRCHGVNHQGQGLVAGEDCLKCHPKNFNLLPKNHTKKFILGDHKKMANADPAYCAMCHKPEFCVTCHLGRSTSPGAPTKPVIPVDHTDSGWQAKHGKLYTQGKGSCGACHTGFSCQRCHKTVVPHPPDFISNHKPPKGITASDCNICHRDRRRCQECHHSKVKNGDLVESACVPCHEIAKQKPATDIQNKAIAEHAVHFNVAKTKGKPYRCYECHVDFGESATAQSAAKQQGHDLRLCYGCHGALDPLNQKIAPYPGGALCLRCHSSLNI
jgi:hypothetical protein